MLKENTGYVCLLCGEHYTTNDIKELRDMGEKYYCEDGCFFCPDCWDKYQQMPVEQQIDILMNAEGTE